MYIPNPDTPACLYLTNENNPLKETSVQYRTENLKCWTQGPYNMILEISYYVYFPQILGYTEITY